MPKSVALANQLLDALLGGNSAAPIVKADTLYLALFTAAPSDISAGTEVAGSGYIRLPVTNVPATWTAASARSKSNAIDLVFAAASGSWGTIVSYALFDAQVAGNMLYRGTFAGPVRADSGDLLTIKAGQLTVTEN